MLGAIKTVRDEARRRSGSDNLTLEAIKKAVDEATVFDELTFAPFEVPETSPFLGRFSKWSVPLGVYSSHKIIVEIAYAKHLSEPWRRFVICKELSHALITFGKENGHEVSESSIRGLVDAFSLQSALRYAEHAQPQNAYVEEKLAEAAAIELLLPMHARESELRQNAYAQRDRTVVERLAKEYNLPEMYVCLGLDENYNIVAKSLFGV